MIEQAQANKEERVFYVLPENWPAVELFLRMQTQWVVAGMGEVVGLSYPAVEALIRIYRVKDRSSVMDDLRTIERAALDMIRREKKTQ